MAKPKVKLVCPANAYTGPDERIVEFSYRAGGKLYGGLIQLMGLDDGLVVSIYNCDRGVLLVPEANTPTPPLQDSQAQDSQAKGTRTSEQERLTEGWGLVRDHLHERKAHYYVDQDSLCGRVGFYTGQLEPDTGLSRDDCAACRKRLTVRKNAQGASI